MRELNVGLAGENVGDLKFRALSEHLAVGDAVGEDDSVRIAHAHTGYLICDAIDGLLFGNLCLRVAAEHRNEFRAQLRGTHIDRNRLHHPVGDVQVKHLYTGEGLKSDDSLVGQTAFVNILADTARGVAAHLGLRAIGIEHAHTEIGHLRAHDCNKAIGADAEMNVAHAAREIRKFMGGLHRGVDVNVVVTGAMHLGECYLLMLCFHVISVREDAVGINKQRGKTLSTLQI